MIEKIWSQDPPYQLKGEFWDISIKDGIDAKLGIGYMPKPYQQPRPPVFISLASPHSSSAKTAAQQGWGMISANIIPAYSVASHWTVYRGACEAAGVTARGDIRACLASRRAVSLRDLVRAGASDVDLAWAMHWALGAKETGHHFNVSDADEHEHVGMSLIGG